MWEGTFYSRIYAYGLLIIGIILLIFCIAKIRFVFPYILAIILITTGLVYRHNIHKAVQTRYTCFHHGKAIKARVIGHHKTLFILKPNKKTLFSPPRKHYSIQVEFIDGYGKRRRKNLHHGENHIWRIHPIGAEVIGLVHEDKSFFGEEMGGTFHFFNK